MKKLRESIDKVCSKYPRVNPKAINAIIEEYQKALLDTLIENGKVYITPDIKVEIVPITPRRYMLRGKEYTSRYNYKLKATVTNDEIYDKISEEYDKWREDLN